LKILIKILGIVKVPVKVFMKRMRGSMPMGMDRHKRKIKLLCRIINIIKQRQIVL